MRRNEKKKKTGSGRKYETAKNMFFNNQSINLLHAGVRGTWWKKMVKLKGRREKQDKKGTTE